MGYVAVRRRKARDSYAHTLGQHGRNWLLPVLADIPLDRLTGEHCAMVFERIDMFNHSTTRITQDLCQHVRLQVQVDSAEQVVALLPGPKDVKGTGS